MSRNQLNIIHALRNYHQNFKPLFQTNPSQLLQQSIKLFHTLPPGNHKNQLQIFILKLFTEMTLKTIDSNPPKLNIENQLLNEKEIFEFYNSASNKPAPNALEKKRTLKNTQKQNNAEENKIMFVSARQQFCISKNQNTTIQQHGFKSVRQKHIPPFKKKEQNQLATKTLSSKRQEEDPRLKVLQQKIIETIKAQILETSPQVKWNDIAGLSFAKKTIHQAIIWPILRPDIFTGLRAPPKGLLLFGPPGTGKTMIGKAIASQSKSTFFNISASSLTSKWVGQGEKMVRALFGLALVKQPSVIFIDEIDSLLCSRNQNDQQSSRRIKTEFLVQFDGAKSISEDRILIIGATNRPEELDEAIRRRFVKRLFIPLPNFQGRFQLLKRQTSNQVFQLRQEQTRQIANLTKGYSGFDLKNVCSEAALNPIRDIECIEKIESSQLRRTNMKDMLQSIRSVKQSVSNQNMHKYLQWNKQFGTFNFDEKQLFN